MTLPRGTKTLPIFPRLTLTNTTHFWVVPVPIPLRGIPTNVVSYRVQVVPFSDDVVVETALPDRRPGRPASCVDPSRRERLEAPNDLRQRVTATLGRGGFQTLPRVPSDDAFWSEQPDDPVDVIRHDHERIKCDVPVMVWQSVPEVVGCIAERGPFDRAVIDGAEKALPLVAADRDEVRPGGGVVVGAEPSSAALRWGRRLRHLVQVGRGGGRVSDPPLRADGDAGLLYGGDRPVAVAWFEVHGAAAFGDQGGLQAELHGVQRGELDAVVER